MNGSLRIALIEDNPPDAAYVEELLSESPGEFVVRCFERLTPALDALGEFTPDCALLDLSLPDAKGLEGVSILRRRAPGLPVVVLTGHADDDLALRALREGASDYVSKTGLDGDHLSRAIRYSVERRAVDRLRDEFISSVSHELRTPLAAIHAATMMMADEDSFDLDPQARRMVAITVRNTDRLRRLVDDILDIGQMTSGRFSITTRACDLGEIVQESVALVAESAREEGIVVVAEAPPCVLDADPDRLVQVLTNLLTNAIKFSPGGSTITIRAEMGAGEVSIDVVDQGPGIPDDHLASIFGEFIQVDASDTRVRGGVGLGLAICRRIIELHGGRIWAEHAPGGGSLLRLRLPTGAATP